MSLTVMVMFGRYVGIEVLLTRSRLQMSGLNVTVASGTD